MFIFPHTSCWAFALFLFYAETFNIQPVHNLFQGLLPFVFVFTFWYSFHNFFSIFIRSGFIQDLTFGVVIIDDGSVTFFSLFDDIQYQCKFLCHVIRQLSSSVFFVWPCPFTCGLCSGPCPFPCNVQFFSNPAVIITISRQLCWWSFLNGMCVGSC